jgi:hypothetical protein
LDGKRHVLALFGARFLVGCGGAQRGIKGNIAEVIAGRARLNIAAAFALSARARAAATAAPRDLIQRVGQFARREGLLGGFYLLATIPPTRIA